MVSLLFCGSDLRVAFSMFDKDGDGHISVSEVHESMKSLGFHIELSRVKLMVKHVDTDGTPHVTHVHTLCCCSTGSFHVRHKFARLPETSLSKSLRFFGLMFLYIRFCPDVEA